METKEIILPDVWEVKEVKGNKIILGEATKTGFPKTYNDCLWALGQNDVIPVRIPCGQEKEMVALGKLLICRNAWWQQLGWKPDWKNCSTVKHCIQPFSEKIDKSTNRTGSVVLAFPTIEIRDQFLETFRDLIEEVKELL